MKSALLVVDSNLEDLKDLEGALAPRYGAEFHLRFASSAREAHVQFGALARAGVPISLVMASRSLPDGDPIVLLNQAREEHPAAKRVLTAHYLDPMAFDVISTAMRRGRIDYFINKPWEPRFDRLYPTLDDLLAGTRTPSEGNKFEAIRIVGERWAPISQKLRDILDRSTVPHGFYDHDSEEGRKILAKAGVDGS